MKRLFIVALVLLVGCGKQVQPEDAPQKDSLIGTTWTAARGDDKRFVLMFRDDGVAALRLESLAGDPLSDTHKGEFTHNGNNVVLNIEYYTEYYPLYDLYIDHYVFFDGTIEDDVMTVGYDFYSTQNRENPLKSYFKKL